MPIYWNQFDWQSFATLTTGLGAVIGATIVGIKQVGIAKRQTDIAANQTEILKRQAEAAEEAIRHSRFEDRFSVYNSVVDFIYTAVDLKNLSPALIGDFGKVVNRVQFLFDNEEIYKICSDLHFNAYLAYTERNMTLNETDSQKNDMLNKQIEDRQSLILNSTSKIQDLMAPYLTLA